MPVTFNVASHGANTYKYDSWPYNPKPKNTLDLVKTCSANSQTKIGRILQSSVENKELENFMPASNGFVHTVLTAYGSHYNLRIRPDDVWLAILVQLSFYIGAHAEELRAYFVQHEGQKRLQVNSSASLKDAAHMAREFASKIHENVADSTLVEWILPDFTTTTLKDRTIASVVMMATLKHYFVYELGITCGIPSVTLEGKKSDWEEINHRLYRLYELGTEPSLWAEMLRPILRRFVDAFDGKPDVEFWSHVVYRDDTVCGLDELSGWITAFCVWSSEGKWLPRQPPTELPMQPSVPPPPVRVHRWKDETGRRSLISKKRLSTVLSKLLRKDSQGAANVGKANSEAEDSGAHADKANPTGSIMKINGYRNCESYTLDGVKYSTIDVEQIPTSFCEVGVVVDDDGTKLPRTMLAGHFGFSISAKEGDGGRLDTVSPSAHWFMCTQA